MKAIRSLFRFLVLLLAGWLFCCQQTTVAGDLLKTEYSYRRYTTHDGLHHMMTETVFQDRMGYLWVGTLKGFARFDGYTFTPFLSETMQSIFRIEDAENGQIRAFGENNCFVVDRNDSIREIHLSDSLVLNSYSSQLLPPGYLIYETSDGKRKYLMQLQNDSLKECLHIQGLNNIRNRRVFWDKRTELLYMPALHWITVYDMKTKEVSYIENVTIENFCFHSRLGLLAIGSGGIYKIDHLKAELFIPHSFERLNKQMLENEDGGLLIRDFLSIYRLSDNRIEELYTGSMALWDMTLDKDNNLWVASNGGLFNFFRFNFKNYRIEGHSIKTVVQDDDGTYWLGGLNDELYKLSGEVLKEITYPVLKSLPGTAFSFGATCINNMLYFPRNGGVLIWDKKNFSWADVPLNYYYNRVVPLGDQYLIVSGDALFYTDQYGRPTRVIDDLKQPENYDMVVDNTGRIITGGEMGLSVITDTVRLIQKQNTRNSLVLCKDKQGNIWSGSENRLNLLRGDSIVTIHAFKENIIVGLASFDDNYLLIAMLKGFYILDVLQYFEYNKLSLLYYDHHNGMTGFEPIINALYIDKKGLVWMPTTDCIVSFDPQKLIRTVSPPIFHIQSCEISTDNVHWEKVNVDKTVFSHKNNNLRFSFIGLKYSAVENVRYSYRLEGFQDEWSIPSHTREAIFNNLRPGNYIFEAYADAGTDDSRSEIKQIRFTIRPAFWQTWWFVAVVILLLMLASTGIALYIQRRKNDRLIEQLETEKQLNELRVKSIRLRSIPHFNANVLAAIEYYVMNLSKDDANRLLNIYSEFTSQTLREVDKASRSLHDELDYVQLYLKLEKLRFMEKFNYEVDIDPEVKQDVQLPNMILHTYCENAVKHGFSGHATGCRLKISARQKDDVVEVSVEDNGVGRIAAAQNKNIRSTKQGLDILTRQIEIYNRFNKKKIIQEVIDLYDGDTPCGTRFMIEVPYGFVYQ